MLFLIVQTQDIESECILVNIGKHRNINVNTFKQQQHQNKKMHFKYIFY